VGSPLDDRIGALLPESGRVLAAAARAVAEHGFVSRPLACALARHATTETLVALTTSSATNACSLVRSLRRARTRP